MKINIFIPLLFFNLCAFCSSKIISTNTNVQDTYFQPLYNYRKELAKYNRLKTFNHSTDKEPVKEKNIILLEKHFKYKSDLETFFNKTIDYYKNENIQHNKKDLAKRFWQTKHIDNIIKFKKNYITYENNLKDLQSKLEQIKFNDKNSEKKNEILQKLITEEINPFTETYKECYEYDQNLLYTFNSANNENLQNINLENLIKHISFNFLKTISYAQNDPKKIDFLNRIYEYGTKKYNPLVENGKLLQKNIHLLLQSIIYNEPLFTGVFDYYNDTANKKFPQIIENAVKDNLLRDVLQYYDKQLNFGIETTPEQELEKIQDNAMTIISLQIKPIVQKRFIKKHPTNLSFDEISDTITSSIFQKEFEFKDYPTIENLIKTIIDNLQLPVNQEDIIDIITVFHTNQNDQENSFEKKEIQQPPLLKKDATKDQIIDPQDLDAIEGSYDLEESLQQKQLLPIKNNEFRLGGAQQSSILIPKQKNIEIFNNSSKTKLERSTSENNISKKRTTTKNSRQLSSKASNTKNKNTNSIKVEPHKNTENKEIQQPPLLKKDAIKDQIIDPQDLDAIEGSYDLEESLQQKQLLPIKNNEFRLGGAQQSSILIPKQKNIEIFNNSSKTKLERSTSENNISKKRTTTRSSPQLLSKASNTKNKNTNSIKVEPHKNTENLESINQGRKSSSHSSFKTPRIVLFSILTLASFWFVVTIFKKLYRFVR